ncbi:16S rRNA (cytidine(1402)-2'-O)-methyltransferase [Ectothiorhodospiraceae bacterium BW-2]|nr:16S rRNA (cytidine(1402)-2'-O)-methyltransferase [Ectothiorhodospiraceae bacterium BW-2]
MSNSSVKVDAATVYIVATPIGNLGDITLRALEVLRQVDCIAAEDTRHSLRLLHHYAINRPLLALHQHNENSAAAQLLKRLLAGESVALISDAGTPLISDPGVRLLQQLHQHRLKVVPIPGPSALTTALSVAAIDTTHFCFYGFLAAKAGQRRQQLQQLADREEALVFYESPHRILDSLTDMADIFGASRLAVVARELTKRYETVLHGSLEQLQQQLRLDSEQQRGEFVILIAAADKVAQSEVFTPQELQLMQLLLAEKVALKQAARVMSGHSGKSKNLCYQRLLALQQ